MSQAPQRQVLELDRCGFYKLVEWFTPDERAAIAHRRNKRMLALETALLRDTVAPCRRCGMDFKPFAFFPLGCAAGPTGAFVCLRCKPHQRLQSVRAKGAAATLRLLQRAMNRRARLRSTLRMYQLRNLGVMP